MEESSILSILKRLVGREVTYTDEFEVEKGMIRRFAIAVGDHNPLYYDDEFARTTAYGGVVAPPTFLFEWNHKKHDAWPPGELKSLFAGLEHQPRGIRGINEYEFIQPVRPGDIIKSRARVTDVYEKQGRSGRLVFIISETVYHNQREETLGKSKDTSIVLP